MVDTRILLIEDKPSWQKILSDALTRAFGEDSCAVAGDYATARQKIEVEEFDLISIDLAFPDVNDIDVNDIDNSVLPGMVLLKELRNNLRTRSCGLIILSGHTTAQRVREALRSYKVFDFLDKLEFEEDRYIDTMRAAVRQSLLDRAALLRETSHKFSVNYDGQRFLRAELTGPGVHSSYNASSSSVVPFEDFAGRADSLNASLTLGNTHEWRPQARRLGEDFYRSFMAHPELLEGLTTALTLTNKRPGNLTLEFSGPVEGLSFPFELLRSNDYFAMDHVLTRRTDGRARVIGFAEPFARFVESLLKSQETLRVLVVGSNTGGIPGAEDEARFLTNFFEVRLEQLAIPHLVTPLIGADATRRRLKETLPNGYHLLHYAGHAAYCESLPEGSALILTDGSFTVSDLRMALREIDLRMAFLSCCLGARTAAQVGRGDFHGFFHALSESGVPTTVGYRWEVEDDSALMLATDFYRILFRDFCPGRALLRARQNRSVSSDQKRDDPTWASPVMLMEV